MEERVNKRETKKKKTSAVKPTNTNEYIHLAIRMDGCVRWYYTDKHCAERRKRIVAKKIIRNVLETYVTTWNIFTRFDRRRKEK